MNAILHYEQIIICQSATTVGICGAVSEVLFNLRCQGSALFNLHKYNLPNPSSDPYVFTTGYVN